jgi:hypothetical protein
MRTDAPLALLLAVTPLASAAFAGVPEGVSAFVYSEHVIVRVPLPRSAPPLTPRWREGKGPRCIDLGAIAGAAISAPDSVDFVLKGGTRVRAKLDRECPALDYYSGFYLRSAGDARICADRDSVHARSGGACAIDRFRLLKPRR